LHVPLQTENIGDKHGKVIARVPVSVKDVSAMVSSASQAATGAPKRIPVVVKDVSSISQASSASQAATGAPKRIPVIVKDVSSEHAATDQGPSSEDNSSGSIDAVAKQLAKKINGAMVVHSKSAQTLTNALKKLMEIEGAIKSQIARVHNQSKQLFRVSQHQAEAKKSNQQMSISELQKKFEELRKKVHSHEQMIGDLKKKVAVHMNGHSAVGTAGMETAPHSIQAVAKQLAKEIHDHVAGTEEDAVPAASADVSTHTVIRKEPTATITGASTAVQPELSPSSPSKCTASPIICSAAAQLAAEIKKHSEYTRNLDALQQHVNKITSSHS
jgi:hypothetical protein